jgi:hypothetical protein
MRREAVFRSRVRPQRKVADRHTGRSRAVAQCFPTASQDSRPVLLSAGVTFLRGNDMPYLRHTRRYSGQA